MRMALQLSHTRLFPDIWHGLVQMMASESGEDPEGFRRHCYGELRRIAAEHARSVSAPPKSVGLANRARHADIARNCALLVSPDDAMRALLLETARATLQQSRELGREGRAFWLAEMKLCLLLGRYGLEEVGLTPGELYHLEVETAEPEVVRYLAS